MELVTAKPTMAWTTASTITIAMTASLSSPRLGTTWEGGTNAC